MSSDSQRFREQLKTAVLKYDDETGDTPTGIDVTKLALYLVGGFALTVATGTATVLGSTYASLVEIVAGFAGFLGEIITDIGTIPIGAIDAAWRAPLAFVTSFGVLSGPLGLGLVIVVLVLIAQWWFL